jgi:hypothetical protein
MGNRCLHELKTINADEVAKKMELEESCSIIEEKDLGSSVLTLSEVMQTFESSSTMFNIKLRRTSIDCRTVILTKNKVEVDGASKLLVMINDVSDRVKLE